ncbi:MAG TPA: acyl-CoA dehydrogenase family protein [Gaiellales bacterium]|nr:acyl-CoA dehydrogenase family protein [Gaiellales bacterium]
MSDAAAPAVTPEIRALRERYATFMDEHVYPNEAAFARGDDASQDLIADVRRRAREAGLWAPHIGPEAGGTGQGFLAYAFLNEQIGRSYWGQLAFGCQAPDAGNGEILALAGTAAQKAAWLAPLVAGDVRSFFGMTEPEVSGADPTGLESRARGDGDALVIDGHKWFSTGADGAAFGIVMAVTDPSAPPRERMSLIVVPADTPGVEVVRRIEVFGHEGRGWDSHCEVRFAGVRVPMTNTLGERGDGFRLAQLRLGPGRIHHAMRWIGQMQRAFDLMCVRSLERTAFGEPLAEKGAVQTWIADSAAQITACRLMTLDAAAKIDRGEDARVAISLVKSFAAGALHDVIDRAVQVHGALGVSGDSPLAAMYLGARYARILDGPDEVHRMVVARRILERYRSGDGWSFE